MERDTNLQRIPRRLTQDLRFQRNGKTPLCFGETEASKMRFTDEPGCCQQEVRKVSNGSLCQLLGGSSTLQQKKAGHALPPCFVVKERHHACHECDLACRAARDPALQRLRREHLELRRWGERIAFEKDYLVGDSPQKSLSDHKQPPFSFVVDDCAGFPGGDSSIGHPHFAGDNTLSGIEPEDAEPLSNVVSSLEKTYDQTRNLAKSLRQENKELEKQLEKVHHKNEDLSQRLSTEKMEQRRKEVARLKELSEALNRTEEYRAEAHSLREKLSNQISTINLLQSREADLVEQLTASEGKAIRLEHKIREIEDAILVAKADVEQREEAANTLESQSRGLQIHAERLIHQTQLLGEDKLRLFKLTQQLRAQLDNATSTVRLTEDELADAEHKKEQYKLQVQRLQSGAKSVKSLILELRRGWYKCRQENMRTQKRLEEAEKALAASGRATGEAIPDLGRLRRLIQTQGEAFCGMGEDFKRFIDRVEAARKRLRLVVLLREQFHNVLAENGSAAEAARACAKKLAQSKRFEDASLEPTQQADEKELGAPPMEPTAAEKAFQAEATDGMIAVVVGVAVARRLGLSPSREDEERLTKAGSPDGAVDWTTFQTWLRSAVHPEDSAQMFVEFFRAYDPEDSGFLRRQQIRNLCMTFGDTMSEEEVDMALDTLGATSELVNYRDFCTRLVEARQPEEIASA